MRADLQSDVGYSKDRVQEIQKQLDDVLEQLGDARIDKHEDARRKKKQEIVERFKSNYPGVVIINNIILMFTHRIRRGVVRNLRKYAWIVPN